MTAVTGEAPCVVGLDEADASCGGKAWSLARLVRHGVPVPGGVVVRDALAGDGWVLELERALGARAGDLRSQRFAVRSSAPAEDGAAASFAGQLSTALDVGADALVDEVRRCARSGASARLDAYTSRLGRTDDARGSTVPVVVQDMVDADVAGVLFTRDPVTGTRRVVVEAADGHGERVVDGRATPQRWVVQGSHVTGPAGPAPPLLTTAQVLGLAAVARRVEAVSDGPQDVEWAVVGGTAWVLQARPITTTGPLTTTPPRAEDLTLAAGDVLLTGVPSSPGAATGRVRVVRDLGDFDRFTAGDVLVCRATSPAWTPLLARAAGVVTEVGGILSHAAVVAREFGVPAVTDVPGATAALADGQRVTVDGTRGAVAGAREADGADSGRSRP